MLLPGGIAAEFVAGWGLTYSTIDSKLDPHEGLYFRFAQDFAGLGGDARYIRSTADARLYTPLLEGSDMVGLLKVAGGNITGLGQPVATIDNFFKGGETIRGFAPLGYGPRYCRQAAPTSRSAARTTSTARPRCSSRSRPAAGLRPARGGVCRCRHAVGRGRAVELHRLVRAGDSDHTTTWRSAPRSAPRSSGQSPFGPIRADFAKALTKKSYDSTQFFRIGTSAQF